MLGAIKTSLPHTRHRWCKWHVLRKAKEKLGSVYIKQNGFKKEFNCLVSELTDVEEFEKRWAALTKKYGLVENKYLSRLYNKRDMWAKPYFMGIFCGGMTSTQRSESANHLLKQFIPVGSSMQHFVRQYNNFLRSRNADEGREEHYTKIKSRVYRNGTMLEEDVAKLYTRAIFNKFQEEMFHSGSYVCFTNEPGLHYTVCLAPGRHLGHSEPKRYEVRLEDDGALISCECGYISHIGLLCRHSIKVLLAIDFVEIPRNNVLKRWTMQCVDSNPDHLPPPAQKTAGDDAAQRQKLLYLATSELVKEAAVSNEAFKVAMASITATTNRLREKKQLKEVEVTNVPRTIRTLGLHESDDDEYPLPPPRPKRNGRPPTVRPKSRMVYVADKLRKTRPLSTLYVDEGNSTENYINNGQCSPVALAGKKIVHCQRCNSTGHSRLKCTKRGF